MMPQKLKDFRMKIFYPGIASLGLHPDNHFFLRTSRKRKTSNPMEKNPPESSTRSIFECCDPCVSKISEPKPDSILRKIILDFHVINVLIYLFSLIYEMEFCRTGEVLIFDDNRGIARIKLEKEFN